MGQIYSISTEQSSQSYNVHKYAVHVKCESLVVILLQNIIPFQMP